MYQDVFLICDYFKMFDSTVHCAACCSAYRMASTVCLCRAGAAQYTGVGPKQKALGVAIIERCMVGRGVGVGFDIVTILL